MAPRVPRQISEITNRMIDPLLAKKAGISTVLLASWSDIVGPQFAKSTRPQEIKWQSAPRDVVTSKPDFKAGVLIVACEGAQALFLSHTQKELIDRVNSFFGFPAISKIKIVQKPIGFDRPLKKKPALAPRKREKLDQILETVDDPKLKAALERLGTGVMSRKGKN